MSDLFWILLGGVAMSLIALSGMVSLLLRRETLDRLLLPLVALAAGTLLGGAFFHMIPEASGVLSAQSGATWLLAGFAGFLALEQWLHWHHGHRSNAAAPRPWTVLILIGDGVHNFIGGLAVAGTFLISPAAGISAWLAAAAHEIPQELGDFGALVHGGWSRRRALVWNFVSALGFPVGALCAWLLAHRMEIAWLVMFGAGNFLYIAASDLIPEIKAPSRGRRALLHFGSFVLGLVLMGLLASVFSAR